MSESKKQECLICLEDVPGKNVISCGFCEYKGCISCTRKSILFQTSDPRCPSCDHAWSQEFCLSTLGKTWMKKDYKEHKKKLLFDIEKSKIPNTMPAVERIVSMNKYKKEQKEKTDEITKLYEKIHELEAYNRGIDVKIRDLEYKKIEKNIVYNEKCPRDGCDGYLNKDFICAMCEAHVCKHCFEIKEIVEFLGESKTQKGVYKYNHECNEDSIESFKLIKKETKPCPNCSTRISKISGCDQMWCTQCHVTFSWTTGLKVTGTIHNPHYYEWKKNNAETATFRNVGEILCGGVPDLNYISNMYRKTQALRNVIEKKMTWEIEFAMKPEGDNFPEQEWVENSFTFTSFGVNTEVSPCFDELGCPNIMFHRAGYHAPGSCLFIPIFGGSLPPTIFNTIHNMKEKYYSDFQLTDIRLYNSTICDKLTKAFYCATIRQELFFQNLLKMHRAISHFENYELHYLRIAVRDIDDKDEKLRIKYIMKEIDEKHYKMLIMKKNNKKQKLIKMLHIFEMCYVTILETFNDIIATIFEINEKYNELNNNYINNISKLCLESRIDWYNLIYKKWKFHTVINKKEKIIGNYDRMSRIINYCNKELWKLSKLYNQNVAFIDYGVKTKGKYYERLGYLNTLSIKWDDDIFQLKEEVVGKFNKKKLVKLKGKIQDNHFNSCWLFCNKENFNTDSKYGGYNSFGTVYNYSYIISVQEILNNDHTTIYDKFGFERSTTQRIYRRYGAGSSLFA